MTKGQLRYQLRKEGYLLRKRGDSYMIVDGERNCAVAVANLPCSLSLEQAEEWGADLCGRLPSSEACQPDEDRLKAMAAR